MNFLIFFILILVQKSQSIIIECEYEFSDYFGYFCKVQNAQLITSEFDRDITGIKGKHNETQGDDKVVGFAAYDSVIKFFPKHLTKFFRNLANIRITNSSLEDITKEDLRQFGDKLNIFGLTNNPLTTIENDLFEFNKNLTVKFKILFKIQNS